MKYWFYRWFMVFAHRYGWHKMDEFHPEGDTLLWCQWCGLRVVTKRRLTQRAADGAISAFELAAKRVETYALSLDVQRHIGLPDPIDALNKAATLIRNLANPPRR